VPLVQGVLGHCAGLDPVALATVVLYEVLTVPAAAAIRLLGLDPLSVTAQAVALEDDVNWLAVEAARSGSASLGELPAPASPRLDLLSEMQFMMEGRLFAS
jgi:urease accessory protein